MKSKCLLVILSVIGLIGCLCITCSGDTQAPSTYDVDKNVIVAVYSTLENEEHIDTVSPYLLEDSVHISSLLHYPGDDDITMPFSFSDTAKWAEITEKNLNKRIAITINGQVIYTPIVKMKIDNGACSVLLNSNKMKKLFPNINFEKIISEKK
ncbi:MAG: hypothetical protein K2H47_10845 [Muribaculaceae bacterium]|nr:hypothetical protein [Muribaculaceae bacterium]